MLSQLSRTIKMAPKFMEQECQLPHAHSAIQRFPVVKWHQRTEEIVAVLPLVNLLLELKPGGQPTENLDHFDLSPTTTTRTLYTKLTPCNLIGTNGVI